jgi:uroporphyrin-III C-methyltransferase
MSGIVHLVGAGPGDPELITRRGARLLAQADAVVHDRLVSPDLLSLAPAGALRYDVGKAGYRSSVAQSTTTRLLIRLARAGMRVVRLKGGDPFVFGRGGEEALELARAGVRFEVVPGVTAGVAGPARAGIPLTHRGLSRSVAFVTAVAADGDEPDWGALSAIDTLVVFMAGRAARATAEGLLAAGRPGSTPVAVIRSVTTGEEDVSLGDLTTLAADGVASGDGRPTLLVVGAVAALGRTLALRDPGRPRPWAAQGSTPAAGEVAPADHPAARTSQPARDGSRRVAAAAR